MAPRIWSITGLVLLVINGLKGGESVSCSTIDGGGWQLVRRVQKGNNWHPKDDNLAGTAIYGGKAVYTNNDETIDDTFSIQFNTIPYKEFLFSSGDCTQWLIVKKDNILNKYLHDTPVTIEKSSINPNSYQARWYNRVGNTVTLEDPWISLRDHHTSDPNGNGMLYGENNDNRHAQILPIHNGANVWIRNKLPPCHERLVACSASGDPHFATFDGLHHHFQGLATYKYVSGCNNNGNDQNIETGLPLIISGDHYLCNARFTCTRSAIIHLYNSVGQKRFIIRLLGLNSAQYIYSDDGRPPNAMGVSQSLDLNTQWTFDIFNYGHVVRFKANLFDANNNNKVVYVDFALHSMSIHISQCLINQVCGLCGKYNNNMNDEFHVWDSNNNNYQILSSTGSATWPIPSTTWNNLNTFGDSWCDKEYVQAGFDTDVSNNACGTTTATQPPTDCTTAGEAQCLTVWNTYCKAKCEASGQNALLTYDQFKQNCWVDSCLQCPNLPDNNFNTNDALNCFELSKQSCDVLCPGAITQQPTRSPTMARVTPQPTKYPTPLPTLNPTPAPTSVPTPAPVVPTPSPTLDIKICKIDSYDNIVFVVDKSGDASIPASVTDFNNLKNLLKNSIGNEIDVTKTNIGITQYSNPLSISKRLSDTNTKPSIDGVIDGIQYITGDDYMSFAVKRGIDLLRGINDPKNLVIVINDNKDNNQALACESTNYQTQVQPIRDALNNNNAPNNVDFITIGINYDSANLNKFNCLVDDNKDLIPLSSNTLQSTTLSFMDLCIQQSQ